MARFKMLSAIDLDNKVGVVANEVDDVRAYWGLTPEARSRKPAGAH